MAVNSARGNIIDAPDGPMGGNIDPPPVAEDVKRAVLDAATTTTTSATNAGGGSGDKNEGEAKQGSTAGGRSGTGLHESGQEPGMEPDPNIGVEKVPGK